MRRASRRVLATALRRVKAPHGPQEPLGAVVEAETVSDPPTVPNGPPGWPRKVWPPYPDPVAVEDQMAALGLPTCVCEVADRSGQGCDRIVPTAGQFCRPCEYGVHSHHPPLARMGQLITRQNGT